MVNSRSLSDLLPPARARAQAFLDACGKQGIDILITSTYRDLDSQAALFAQGRTAPGKRVTNAKPGQSFHNWRVAFDMVPLRAGKPVWNTTGPDADLWERIGKIGESVGLEWAGRWVTFREFAHFQYTGGLSLAQLAQGLQPAELSGKAVA
jgi:peptidoglycan L-alanyl-D-glutamate endopeptidase CwlK